MHGMRLLTVHRPGACIGLALPKPKVVPVGEPNAEMADVKAVAASGSPESGGYRPAIFAIKFRAGKMPPLVFV